MTSPRPAITRPTIGLVAALATVAAWLATSAINHLAATVGAGPRTAAVLPLLPATGPSWIAASATPWQFLVPLVAALALGTIVLGCVPAALAAIARTGRTPVFWTVWACLVAASAGLGLLWAVGGIIADWPPARLVFLLRDVQPAVGAGAYWGLAWGWAPAWVAAAVGRGMHRRRTVSRRAVAVLRLLPAVGCAALLLAALPLASEANRAVTPQPPPTAEPAPAPVPIGQPTVSYAIEDGAPGSLHPAGGTWCAGGDVHTVLGAADAATGHRSQELRTTNTSSRPCRLGGYPDVAFDDPQGNAMNVLFYRGGSFMTTDPGPSAVVLQPGASATAMLGWNAMAAAGDTTAGTILIAPYAGTDRTRLPAGPDAGGPGLDILDGSAVAITAWSAGG
ncbi:DUF4232 domain-containing protein [Arthrobacter sp.]|uniref:DUF4232 domain-containing protein n=1 Tax=Arthrobacter sp. TaxID=1667 RepID=UPI003A8D46B5